MYKNDIKEIREMLLKIYKEDEIDIWLLSKNKLLDNQIAVSLIFNGEANKVKQVVQQLLDGVYI